MAVVFCILVFALLFAAVMVNTTRTSAKQLNARSAAVENLSPRNSVQSVPTCEFFPIKKQTGNPCDILCQCIKPADLLSAAVDAAIANDDTNCSSIGYHLRYDEPQISVIQPGWFKTNATIIKITIRDLLSQGKVKEIEPGSFDDCTFRKMTELVIKWTEISVLKKGVFDGVSNLKTVTFDENRNMCTVEASVLDPLYQLEEIRMVKQSQFENLFNLTGYAQMKHVRTLTLNLNNFTSSIDATTFRGCINVESINLSNSAIESIGPGSFDHMAATIQFLDLRNNKLKHLPSQLLAPLLRPDVQIFLSGNPWHCDCDALELQFWSTDSSGVIADGPLVCEMPPPENGYHVSDVDLSSCEPIVETTEDWPTTTTQTSENCPTTTTTTATTTQTTEDWTTTTTQSTEDWTTTTTTRTTEDWPTTTATQTTEDWPTTPTTQTTENSSTTTQNTEDWATTTQTTAPSTPQPPLSEPFNCVNEKQASSDTLYLGKVYQYFNVKQVEMGTVEIETSEPDHNSSLSMVVINDKDDVQCRYNVTRQMTFYNLEPNAVHLFCLMKKASVETSPRNCFPFRFDDSKSIWGHYVVIIALTCSIVLALVVGLLCGCLLKGRYQQVFKAKELLQYLSSGRTSTKASTEIEDFSSSITSNCSAGRNGSEKGANAKRLRRTYSDNSISSTKSYITAVTPSPFEIIQWKLRKNPIRSNEDDLYLRDFLEKTEYDCLPPPLPPNQRESNKIYETIPGEPVYARASEIDPYIVVYPSNN